MTGRKVIVLGLVVALAAVAVPVSAEHHEDAPGAYARNLAFVGDRVVQLAEAMSQEQYGWRPMEGVRSVSEAIMHMAGANYFFAGRFGAEAPEGVDPAGFEAITDKAEVVSTFKASMEHLSKAIDGVTDPSAATQIFGREGTIEDMMLIAIGHAHEHFGQLIAYARSNQVVPPWSQPAEGSDG